MFVITSTKYHLTICWGVSKKKYMDSTAIKMICSVLFGVWGLTLRLFAVKCAAESVAESECHAVAPN